MTRFRLTALAIVAAVLTAAGYGTAHRGSWHAASVTSRVSAAMSSTQQSTLDLGTASYSPNLAYSLSLTNGTGTNQFQIVYADSGTIAASDSVLLDLAGSATDGFGQTFTCATMKGIELTAKSANTNNVIVGGATVAAVNFLGTGAAGDTTMTVSVKPGGVFMWVAPGTGATVTGGSRDIIRIKNSGGTTGVGYSLQILCR